MEFNINNIGCTKIELSELIDFCQSSNQKAIPNPFANIPAEARIFYIMVKPEYSHQIKFGVPHTVDGQAFSLPFRSNPDILQTLYETIASDFIYCGYTQNLKDTLRLLATTALDENSALCPWFDIYAIENYQKFLSVIWCNGYLNPDDWLYHETVPQLEYLHKWGTGTSGSSLQSYIDTYYEFVNQHHGRPPVANLGQFAYLIWANTVEKRVYYDGVYDDVW